MATSGLYGSSPNGAVVAAPNTQTAGLYGSSTEGAAPAAPSSETNGLYGSSTNFGGTYFEWIIFQESASQPSTPTGGSWNFNTNTGTPPSGWSNAPVATPTNPVWISIGIVNSRTTTPIVWSTPGVLSYSGQLNGSGAPTSGVGLNGEFYIQTGVSPCAIWYKDAGTWLQVTGTALYVALTGDQTIGGTKTFSQVIQGSISGNAATATYATSAGTATNATHATSADSATYATSAGNATTADTATNATHATNADHVPYTGLTGTVPIWNQDTTGNAATANYATSAGHANSSDTATYATSAGSATHATTADSATTATTASSVGHSLTAIADGTTQTFNGSADVTIGSVPTAGTAGQVLAKIDSTNFNVGWIDNYSTALKTIVKNQTGSTLPKGTVVYVSGGTGANILVAKAQANAESTSSQTFGFLENDIANGSSGYVINQGTLTGIDTSAYNDGDPVYLSPTVAGGWVAGLANKPYAPYHLVYLGTITRSQNNNGTIAVKVQNGYELDELHNVSARNPVNGQTIIYNQSTSLWEKANITAGSGISITNGAGSITIANTSPSTGGTVTSVDTAGAVSGLTLTGGPITSSGTITLGGSLDLSSPPVIGGTTPNSGTFTTLTATGQTSLGGAAGSEGLRVTTTASANRYVNASGGVAGSFSPALGTGGGTGGLALYANQGAINFFSDGNATTQQMSISRTASAVNYVQVTGAATTGAPTISTQGSDAAVDLTLTTKSTGIMRLQTGNANVFRLRPAASAVNYFDAYQSATGKTPYLQSVGSDTNVPFTILTQGTGAIDLAAGSSGVNISNGGTVTAITLTNNGGGSGGYTGFPTITISPPTTAGGVQATATVLVMQPITASVQSGGTGYTLNDVVSLVGGTPQTAAATFRVTGVSGGVVTAVTAVNYAPYLVLPTAPVSTTGGTGTGLTLTSLFYAVGGTFTITNAGSGYVEQPTVSFSGGGGSGAAAYATVGSGTVVKSAGSTLSFSTPGGEGFRVSDGGSSLVNYVAAYGSATNPQLIAQGSGTNVSMILSSKGSGSVAFYTGNFGPAQFNVAHTASAVNYVQVTGAATTASPTISAQGSDANIVLRVASKGTQAVAFSTNYSGSGTGNTQVVVSHTANSVNYLQLTGSAAGSAPVFSSQGNDTNIDLALTPKGTGRVKFGTYTANMALTVQGYIEILDSGGTVRKLAVIA